ncbi:MAG TPA: signal peptidase I [Pyrinomonadaceae bacterium]|jgi:signal peptidase I
MFNSTKLILLLIFLVAISTSGCYLMPVRVEGTAMMPTLKNGDRIFVDRNVNNLKRGDIVVFRFPKNHEQSFVKRIVGLPNESVEIRQGQIFINGKILEEPYLSDEYNQVKSTRDVVQIPDGNYFVMGDNRDNSYDSRNWGTVPKNLIYGVYYTTYLKSGN